MRVDCYWGEPSLGLGPEHMNSIGSQTVQVEYHQSKEVRVPWIPISAGHQCLIVNASCDINDPIELPFQPRLDRHVAQRNIDVIQAAAAKSVTFSVGVNNIAPLMATTRVTARLEHVALNRKAAATMSHRDMVNHVATYVRGEHADVVRDVADESRFGRSAPQIRSQLSERSSIVRSREGASFFSRMLLASDQPSGPPVDTSRDITLHEVVMQGFEHRQLDLELGVPGNAGPGEFVVYHLIQYVAGLQVGGYTIVVEIPGARGEG